MKPDRRHCLKAFLCTLTTVACMAVILFGAGLFARPAMAGPVAASGNHYVGQGLDVTAVSSLNTALGGVHGSIQVVVSINGSPVPVRGVIVAQSYHMFGQSIYTRLSQLGKNGNTWTFALFADHLNRNEPFVVSLFPHVLRWNPNGPPNNAFATLQFRWPTDLLEYMGS